MARLCCCVPFCHRTTGYAEYGEWICGPHWTAIPKSMRRAHNRLRRIARKCSDTARDALARRQARIWKRLKKEAVNRAVGIS